MNEIPSPLITVINQLFDLEKKINKKGDLTSLERHVRRIRQQFELLGLQYHNPVGQPYDITRTDCEANILSGNATGKMKITDVIKPLITHRLDAETRIIQKAVVIVE